MKKKKIVMYAHYYAPDVASTGQILQDLAEGLIDVFDITVICTVPSYEGIIEEKYREDKFYYEKINAVSVIRVPVPEFDKTSKKSRVINILSYYLKARKATKSLGFYDYVFAVSQPPILGGMLGVYAKKVIKKASGNMPKLIYNIQDFNPEQIMAIGYIKNKLLLSVAECLDKRSCRKSDLIITVGRDLVETLKNRFKGSNVPNHTMINNWIDERNVYPLSEDNPGVVSFKNKYGLNDKFVFMYSGNIGLYYDLEGIIKVISKFKGAKSPNGSDVVFIFVGAGSVLEKLKMYKDENSLDNVIFIPYQDRDKLVYSLNSADVHWCVNSKGIKGASCPSKFYGIIAVGKPVLGVLEKGSEVEMLINELNCGRVSEPGNYKAIEENIASFLTRNGIDEYAEMGRQGYEYFIRYLTKDIAISKYIDAINNL